VIDEDTYTRLADSWDLANKTDEPNVGILTEYGHLTCHAYTWDGMEWERAGSSPIVWMNLKVSEPIETELVAYRWCG
jgi:hypothetical protein